MPAFRRALDEGEMIVGLLSMLPARFGRFLVPRARPLAISGFIATAAAAFVAARVAVSMATSSSPAIGPLAPMRVLFTPLAALGSL